MPPLLKKILKIVAWIITSVVLLLVIVALVIQIPAVQLRLTKKAVAFLEEKIGTNVDLEGISISFPKSIVLEGLYMEDQDGDTLLYAGRFSVDTDLWGLTRSELRLDDISLERTVAFVDRAENDSAFNFTYILEAFAGDSTAVPDTLEQKSWDFSLGTLTLEDIRLLYDDRLAGNYAQIALGSFELVMDEFDLATSTFGVEDILLAQTDATFRQTKVPSPAGEPVAEAKADSAAAVIFSLDELVLRDVDLRYEQVPLGQVAEVSLGEAEIRAEKIDLAGQEVILDEVSLHHTTLAYERHPADTVVSGEETPDDAAGTQDGSAPWKLAVNNIDLSDNSMRFDDFTMPRVRGQVDFSHLLVTAFDIDATAISFQDNRIAASLHNLSFREQSGFSLRSMKGDVEVNATEAALEGFLLETGHSRLAVDATAQYSSLQNIADEYPRARISATIQNSSLNLRDIAYFQPSIYDSLPVNLPEGSSLAIDAAVRGTVNDLRIDHLLFNALSETSLNVRGRVAGLPSAENLRMDVSLDKFRTTKRDLETILPDTLLPDSLQLPSWIEVSGGMNGTLQKARFSAHLTSSAGAIALDGRMNTDSASALRGFDGAVSVDNFAVGRTLGVPDSVMGNVTLEAKIRTAGLTPEEMDGMFTATVRQFSYNSYRYEGLKLYGTIRDQMLSVNAALQDENLRFTLDAGYAFGGEVPRYELTLDMKNADLRALNLSASPIRARGTLLVDLATSDFKTMNGNVGIRKVAVFNGDKLFAIDSLLFASIDQEGRAEINIDSDLLEADFKGSINIFGLPDVMREYFHSYYALHDSLEVRDAAPQHFSFEVKIKNTEILTGLLVPELTTFVPGEIKGEFDSRARKLDLQMHIRKIQYANIGIDSLVFSTKSDRNALQYGLTADRILVDSMRVDGLLFSGKVASDSIRTELAVLDSANNDKYVLAGTFHSLEEGFAFSFLPESILLNYQKWSVPASNYMEFGGTRFIARDVELSNGREKIMIASDRSPASPIRLGFREMNLEYLVSMIAEEKPMSGLLNGDIELFPAEAGMTFTSDLTVDDFRLRQVDWGDLSVQVARNTPERFDVDVSLKGANNDVGIRGFYSAGATPAMNLTMHIDRFNLPSLQPLLKDQVSDLEGQLEGEIVVKGTPQVPDVDGKIVIRDTRFHSTFLNSAYSIDEEAITFVDEGIAFDRFEIADNDANRARIDGNILTRTYRDFRFGLTLTTDEFRLLNTTAKDNDLFYGKVDVEAVARIGGTMGNPVIDMQIGLAEGSNLTYVVPQSEASVLETEGIVTFVDRTFEGDPFMRQVSGEAADTVKSSFTGIDLTARLELSDQENFTIIIDPVTEDQLTVRGNSTLTLKIDPSGDIQLAGRYEITEGTYNLSFYKFVKREFSIEKGSTITWSGDPFNADMDITAIYRVETAPMELFSNQLAGADATEVNQYRQRLPFLVYLNITGQLLQPEIGFALEMPMNERNAFGGSVYARLQDINTRESDLNKQVFALLILKRFISDNPFESQSGGGFESTARSSVSKILSEQLNRLSENIKGVELSFDIKSYEEYSSGQAQGQTELQLGVSKSLLNDRLVVKLSGNVDVEGQNTNREATDYIGDLALEYKITPDGRFRITGFRNSNYDMIDGELTETGAGLIYVKDYNALRELFKANAHTRN